MPAVCQRTVAREERQRVLTSAVITAERPVAGAIITISFAGNSGKADSEVSTTEYEPSPEAYQPKATSTEDTLDDKIARIIGDSDTMTGHRQLNPKKRFVRRCDCQSGSHDTCAIRKDHGTTARRKQIEALNVAIAEGKQSRRTVRRRLRKNAKASGNPRRYKAALKRQARTGR